MESNNENRKNIKNKKNTATSVSNKTIDKVKTSITEKQYRFKIDMSQVN